MTLGYRPELDGFRGVAVLLVLFFHSTCPWFPGGFIGVDLFFVLSGFLITTILVQEWQRSGRISYGRFLLRRMLRLLPALWILCAVYFALIIAAGYDWQRHALDTIYTLTYISNWTRALGYYRPGFLGHTWSLSIEEQFYLLWPSLLLLVLTCTARSGLRIAIVIALATGFAVERAVMALGGASTWRLYNGLDTRADALLIGCALALIHNRDATKRCGALGTAMAVLGVAAFALAGQWDAEWMMLGGYTLLAVLAAMLILHLLQSPDSPMSRLMRWPPLRYVGRISYGVYLWHFPVMAVLKAREEPWPVVLMIGGSIALIAATASYYLVERRFLRVKARFESGAAA